MYTSYYDPNDSEFNEDTAKAVGQQIGEQIAAVLVSLALGAITALVAQMLLGLLVTNYHKQSYTGDKTLTPTEDTTALDSRETAAVHQDSQLSHEEFKAQESNLAGANTDACAANAETDATTADVAATKTQAGTIDTSATAMQIN